MKQNLSYYIDQLLRKNFLLTIATHAAQKLPWISTVYYVNESDLTIYFLSNSKSQHVQHIARYKQVAASVVNSSSIEPGKRAAIQMKGEVEELTTDIQKQQIQLLWEVKIKQLTEKKVKVDQMYQAKKIYAFKPSYISILNEPLFGENIYKTWER